MTKYLTPLFGYLLGLLLLPVLMRWQRHERETLFFDYNRWIDKVELDLYERSQS